MRALHVPEAGGQPVLGDLPTPEVVPGHVLIKVRAAGLNPLDNVIAAGFMAERFPHHYPLVLGRDAAGVVEAVGAGVDHVEPGQEVFGNVPLAPPIQAGTLAEYALLPAETVVVKPAGLDFATAAALPLAAAAASAAVDLVEPQPGQVVLVNGASGGVGRYAVQLLAARSVTVVATGTPDDAERLSELGATTVVNFAVGPVADQVLAVHPDGVDALVNLVGFALADVPLEAVRKGGRVATTTPAPDADALAGAGLAGGMVFAQPVRETTESLAELAAAGLLSVDVHSVLPLERAAEGLGVLAAGQARGKIVVTLGD
ncbi:NADP-dependent oxidoreductase [Streptomyces coeruleorubidus]|uniref:NADP-dependent oxidoreductase n=1 Tax=Streptomyces coeruleorubidus TaxID=116188 RepID=UPI0033A162A6